MSDEDVTITIDQASAQAILNVLSSNILDVQKTAKWYVDDEIQKVNESITSQLGDKQQQLEEIEALHSLLFTAVDKADLTEDGQIKLQGTMESILAKVSQNETLVAGNLQKIGALETALSTEIQDRVAQGQQFTTLVENMRKSLQDQITAIKQRVLALENKMAGVEEFAETLIANASNMAATTLANVNALYGKPADDAPVLQG